MVNGVATINLDRCIGCGNCVVMCASGAVQLRRKKEETVPPKDAETLYRMIMAKKAGTWNMLKMGAKMLLKMRV
jgi:electron transport complex protein RnfB